MEFQDWFLKRTQQKNSVLRKTPLISKASCKVIIEFEDRQIREYHVPEDLVKKARDGAVLQLQIVHPDNGKAFTARVIDARLV